MIKKILPPTTKRVANNTSNKTNQMIREQTISCIDAYKDSGTSVLSEKIKNLNYEWDTERVLEKTAASTVLLSSLIGYKKTKCCGFLITGTVGFFLLQHALQGFCPPLSVIRKLGVRTAEEIFHEKMVFKYLRGDFKRNTDDTNEMLNMAEK